MLLKKVIIERCLNTCGHRCGFPLSLRPVGILGYSFLDSFRGDSVFV